jgi:hypothetical protein
MSSDFHVFNFGGGKALPSGSMEVKPEILAAVRGKPWPGKLRSPTGIFKKPIWNDANRIIEVIEVVLPADPNSRGYYEEKGYKFDRYTHPQATDEKVCKQYLEKRAKRDGVARRTDRQSIDEWEAERAARAEQVKVQRARASAEELVARAEAGEDIDPDEDIESASFDEADFVDDELPEDVVAGLSPEKPVELTPIQKAQAARKAKAAERRAAKEAAAAAA